MSIYKDSRVAGLHPNPIDIIWHRKNSSEIQKKLLFLHHRTNLSLSTRPKLPFGKCSPISVGNNRSSSSQKVGPVTWRKKMPLIWNQKHQLKMPHKTTRKLPENRVRHQTLPGMKSLRGFRWLSKLQLGWFSCCYRVAISTELNKPEVARDFAVWYCTPSHVFKCCFQMVWAYSWCFWQCMFGVMLSHARSSEPENWLFTL